ncbi:MAG: polyprenyl synthetase family protein [Armatimonadetes bacterium]|nr:polyprenyl synthetase family protein [Armatimonadota bacterium]
MKTSGLVEPSVAAEEIARVEATILRVVASRSALIPEVHQHLVQAGGKRLRPTLTILCARAVGGCDERTILFAAMVELTHLASLMHDDIVDHSATRRGKASVNARWSNGVAVLVADWLISTISHELIGHGEYAALGILTGAVRRMCEAELIHLEQRARTWELPEAVYLEIVRDKTGALMAAACELGALAAGATAEQTNALRAFGTAMGMAFQIQDDLLDLTGDPALLGKPVGTDIAMGQLTLPVLYALENSTDGLLDQLRAAVTVTSPDELDIPRLRALVNEAGGIDYSRRAAQTYVDEAVEELACLPEGPAAEALRGLAERAIRREA